MFNIQIYLYKSTLNSVNHFSVCYFWAYPAPSHLFYQLELAVMQVNCFCNPSAHTWIVINISFSRQIGLLVWQQNPLPISGNSFSYNSGWWEKVGTSDLSLTPSIMVEWSRGVPDQTYLYSTMTSWGKQNFCFFFNLGKQRVIWHISELVQREYRQ